MAKRRRLGPATDAPAPEVKSNAFGATKDPFSAGLESKPAPIAGVAGDAAATSALRDMADHIEAARESGRLIIDVPLDNIDTGYLVRDRIQIDSAELESLISSIRARGQQTPIEVARIGPDQYGLISGFRRMMALRHLSKGSPEGGFGYVQCLIRSPETSADAYLAMVEENEIRAGLSYYERARIAARAVDQGVFATEKAALLGLYHAASRPRRSKIRSFLKLVRAFDGALAFPEALSERTGLALVKAMERRDPYGLRTALSQAGPKDAAAELQVVEAFIKGATLSKKSLNKPEQTVLSPCNGVTVEPHADGSLTLRGPAVGDLKADLLAWLSAR